ncbi:M23 family metallopeptidase [Actinotalea sp. M2MS4P-6]|uniref:M23 family metallopeptidase n=1 Tax=Actinotalea sp. M2MS4P-6 TaxID=2983762 RepID=UPI0021E3C4BA|nr:M23 family metallopeptidase [Actinotalea sp. M2MS4P-6]MCV2396193.1 M23 family metallopeptidase [Actinotalea sp. M2MS4P-6]
MAAGESEGRPQRGPVDLAYPFTGRWLVQNSPADRVPSHGTRRYATTFAIDFVPVDDRGRSAPVTARTLVRPEPPERFPGFGLSVTAPVGGTVVAVHDGEPDHAAYRGLPSLWYALTQGRRVSRGWVGLAGNHVAIEASPGVVVVLCHLRRGSVDVEVGDAVAPGERVGECGCSGNSTEPHLHLQAMDRLDPSSARPIPVTFAGGLPGGGTVVTP